jgi:hypothetical protein
MPEHGASDTLVLATCNTDAMQLHFDENATKITQGDDLATAWGLGVPISNLGAHQINT